MNGKEKCFYLKELRNKMAKENGIDYHTDECKFKGECNGTCPKCEAELKELTRKINDKRRRKYLVGMGVGVAALGLVGCTNTSPSSDVGIVGPSVENHSTEEVRLEGDLEVGLTESTEDHIENTAENDRRFSGDVVYVGDLDDEEDGEETESSEICSLEQPETGGALIEDEELEDESIPMNDLMIPTAGVLPPR